MKGVLAASRGRPDHAVLWSPLGTCLPDGLRQRFAFPHFKGVPVLRLTFSNPTPIIRRWHDLMPFGA